MPPLAESAWTALHQNPGTLQTPMLESHWKRSFCWATFLAAGLLLVAPETRAKEEVVIEDGRTVSFEYTLKLDDGSVASTNVGKQPLVYEHGKSEILPALERALGGLKAGDAKKVTLSPEHGYGERNPEALIEVPVEVIPENARQVGMLLVARDPAGNEQQVRVHEVGEERIVLDQNHPLAGERLHFDIKILSVE